MMHFADVYRGNETPYYILSNRDYYVGIADEYCKKVGSTDSASAYKVAQAAVLSKYKHELCNNDVLDFLLAIGEIDSTLIETIRAYYRGHATEYQKAVVSAPLKSGKKYTFVYLDQSGTPVVQHCVLHDVSLSVYGNDADVVKFRIRKKRARLDTNVFMKREPLVILKNWIDVPLQDFFQKESDCGNSRGREMAFKSDFLESVCGLGNAIFVWNR